VKEDYGEDRWIGVGRIGAKVAVVIFTQGPSLNTIRIISLREAEKDEQNNYYTKAF
jgi:uncharacterized DUF497 family protein